MSKLYNDFDYVVNTFRTYFSNFSSSKTLLNFLPEFFCSLIDAESTTSSKISVSLFNSFNDSILLDSHSKRIYRFLHNPKYNIQSLFNSIVFDVLSRFKLSHSDRNIHISFDHMFVKCNFTILMFTLRIGKQGIPIYFEVFDGSNKEGHGDAFKLINIKKGILFCHNLIKSVIPDAHIIFLADRWFGNLFPFMQYINSLGDTFVFRCKQNLKVCYQKYPEKHKIWIPISDLPHLVHASKLYNNLEFTRKKFKVRVDEVFKFLPEYSRDSLLLNTTIDTKLIGSRLKQFRKEKKLTQKQLAQSLNTTDSVICGYESGRRLIATPFLYQICYQYHVSADYLLGRTNEKTQN